MQSPINVAAPASLDTEELAIFERSVGAFLDKHAGPDVIRQWREAGITPGSFWRKAGEAGLLGLSIPPEYGGAGGDFRHEAVLMREVAIRGIEGWDVGMHNAIIVPYILSYGSEEQKQRWFPKMVSGEYVAAIAMTEPGTGSDLRAIRTTARREGDHYVINGSKIFISNGQNAGLIVVAVKTGEQSLSLIVVEPDQTEGFVRGRKLDKIGREYSDTSELFFNDARVPVSNLLGEVEGQGFAQLVTSLPTERLVIAVQSVAAMEFILTQTLNYVRDRKAFGQRIIDFQNTKFKLAEAKTHTTIAKIFLNHCIDLAVKGKLDGELSAMSKYWTTEIHCELVDECLQLFGGYGYMNEYPIAHAYRDARVTRIYGGTTEIMKTIIAKSF